METVSSKTPSGLTPSNGILDDYQGPVAPAIEEGNLLLESDTDGTSYLLIESTGEPLILESTA